MLICNVMSLFLVCSTFQVLAGDCLWEFHFSKIPPTHSFLLMAELTPNCIGQTISEASLTDAVVQVWVQGVLNCRWLVFVKWILERVQRRDTCTLSGFRANNRVVFSDGTNSARGLTGNSVEPVWICTERWFVAYRARPDRFVFYYPN